MSAKNKFKSASHRAIKRHSWNLRGESRYCERSQRFRRFARCVQRIGNRCILISHREIQNLSESLRGLATARPSMSVAHNLMMIRLRVTCVVRFARSVPVGRMLRVCVRRREYQDSARVTVNLRDRDSGPRSAGTVAGPSESRWTSSDNGSHCSLGLAVQ